MKKLLFILLLFSSFAKAQNGQALFFQLNQTAGYTVQDADALAYITAVEGTGRTMTNYEKSVIDTLVMDLKGVTNPGYTTGVNFWARDLAYYPIFGGTAAAHKFNLKDPRDLDAAYRLTLTGTGVANHSATGIIMSGSQSALNTHIQANWSSTDLALSFYSRTNNSGTSTVSMGAYDGTVGLYITAAVLFRAGNSSSASIPYTTTAAFFIGTKSGTSLAAYRNGVQTGINTNSSAPPALDIYLMSRNNSGVPGNMDVRECAWASIGAGMTGTEAAIFNTIINAYETRLSRNVY